MVRTLWIAILCLAVLPALLFPVAPARGEGTDGVYIVKPGDTLSGIAGSELGDFKRWEEILDANPQVTDPELIYPGDTLALPGMGKGSEGIAESDIEPYPPLPVEVVTPADVGLEEAVAEPVEPPMPVEVVRPIPVIAQSIYRSTGYIREVLPEASIVSSLDSKISLVDGDEVFISVPAGVGTAYTIVRPMRVVFHPRTGENMGWMLKVMGWAEVNCEGEKASRAMILNAIDTVQVGDLLMPFDPDDILENNAIGQRLTTFCPEKKKEGYLVAADRNQSTIAGGDIVYLDQGLRDGVDQGDQFIVYRTLDPEGYKVIGQLQLLRVEEKTSSAIVIHSIRELSVADPIQRWEEPPTDETAYGG